MVRRSRANVAFGSSYINAFKFNKHVSLLSVRDKANGKKGGTKMAVIVLLVFISLTLALIFLGAFFWAQKSGQHDDLTTPAMRILFDDGTIDSKNKSD